MTLAERIVRRFLRTSENRPYAALFLDDGSQQRLLAWWRKKVRIPLHVDVKAHHMTIKYDPSPAEEARVPIGTTSSVEVVGYAADEKAQAVLVRSKVRSHNKYPHITVAVSSGISAAYSNDLLAKGVISVKGGPKLFGIVEIRND